MITRRRLLLSVPLSAILPTLLRAADDSSPRVACQANAWGRPANPDFGELLKRVAAMKRLGYEAFECNYAFVQGQFASVAQARDQIAQAGMAFYGPHIGLRQEEELLDRCVEGAAALGAKQFALSGAGSVLTKNGKLDEEAVTKKVAAITRLAARCQRVGMRLAYHNHGQEFISGGAEIEELLRRTDPELVSLLLDLGHAHREGADVVEFFTKHHTRINAMHLRDIRGNEQVPLGQGEVNYAGLGVAVRRSGWRGWLTVEEENLPKSLDSAAIESILTTDRDAIRKFFGV